MKKIEWSDEFSVGVKLLDEEHKHLLGLVNKLIDHRHASIHSEQISTMFGGLMDSVQQHFLSEEELMLKHDFHNYEDHKNQHIDFAQSLINIMDNSERITMEELLGYLIDWFKDHLQHDEQDYGRFFAERGVV